MAWLAVESGLIRYFLDPDLRTRWSETLSFPEEVVSKTNLFILLERKRICKRKLNLIHFVRMCHYLLISEYRVFVLLGINCRRCTEMRRKCKYTHYNENGYYKNYDLIPVLYFSHYIAKWEWMYHRLIKYLDLRSFYADESWSYSYFKKKVRSMFRSRGRWRL